MKATAVERLSALNREFYSQHGDDFSETRLRPQPGVQRLIASLEGDETVLDLGCGNGVLAAELSKRGHRGAYLGLDLSPTLLEKARARSYGFAAQFQQLDLLQMTNETPLAPAASATGRVLTATAVWSDSQHSWSLIAAFAVLHHVPGRQNRLALITSMREWLNPGGTVFVSVWQFLGSPRLKSRIQPWSELGLESEDLDPNDFLMDWRHGLRGLRYVHQFDEAELSDLAAAAGFRVAEAFYSDGQDRHSGLYQVWRRD